MRSPAPDIFRSVAVSSRLEVVDRLSTTFLTTLWLEIEALIRARFFEKRYTWTGGGIEKIPTIESGRDSLGHAHHRLHGPVIYSESRRTFLIDLGRDLQTKERETLEIKQTFIDTHGTFRPFLGHILHSPLQPPPDTLVLQVQLHKTFKRDVRWEIRRAGEPTVLSSEPLAGQSGLYTWEVPNIKSGHHYRIDWSRHQR